MNQPQNPILHEAIMDVVRNQIRDDAPPETRQTLERLQLEGLAETEAMRLIGCVVATEIFDTMKSQEPFDLERFVAGLYALPKMPWADDEAAGTGVELP